MVQALCLCATEQTANQQDDIIRENELGELHKLACTFIFVSFSLYSSDPFLRVSPYFVPPLLFPSHRHNPADQLTAPSHSSMPPTDPTPDTSMSTTTIRPPIHILGCGFAGLTLGARLSALHIPYKLYKQGEPSSFRHDYGVTLTRRTVDNLARSIGVSARELERRCALRVPVRTEEKGEQQRKGKGKEVRLNRQLLDRAMYEVVKENVVPYSELVGIAKADSTSQSQGRCELTFKPKKSDDDSTATTIKPEPGSLVIDALGTHSLIRNSLLSHVPKAQLKVLNFAVYYGGTRNLSRADFVDIFGNPSCLESDGQLSRSITVANKSYLLRVQTTRSAESESEPKKAASDSEDDANAKYSITYTFSRPADPDSPDPLLRADRRKNEAEQIPPALYSEIDAVNADLGSDSSSAPADTALSAIFSRERFKGKRVLNWLMRTLLVPRNSLERVAAEYGVLGVGEAYHSTPLVGSYGANEAVEDAVALAEVIAEEESGRGDASVSVSEIAEKFYDRRYRGWEEEVGEAEWRLADMHKGGDGGRATSTSTSNL